MLALCTVKANRYLSHSTHYFAFFFLRYFSLEYWFLFSNCWLFSMIFAISSVGAVVCFRLSIYSCCSFWAWVLVNISLLSALSGYYSGYWAPSYSI